MERAVYDRSGDDLLTRGLYLDLPALGLPRLRGESVCP